MAARDDSSPGSIEDADASCTEGVQNSGETWKMQPQPQTEQTSVEELRSRLACPWRGLVPEHILLIALSVTGRLLECTSSRGCRPSAFAERM